MYWPRQYGLGTVATFRYTSFTANDRMPMVMVLTPQHRDGHMHGLNLRYMSPLQQRQIQYYFQTEQERQQTIDPFQQDRVQAYQKQLQYQERAKRIEAANKQYKVPTPQELEQKIQQGVIVKPDPSNPTFGVSTFTKTTNAQVQAAGNAMGTLQRYIPYGGEEQPPPEPEEPSPFANLSRTSAPQLTNPYTFYYNYVKPMLREYTSNVYRKYQHQYIQNLRILKGVER